MAMWLTTAVWFGSRMSFVSWPWLGDPRPLELVVLEGVEVPSPSTMKAPLTLMRTDPGWLSVVSRSTSMGAPSPASATRREWWLSWAFVIPCRFSAPLVVPSCGYVMAMRGASAWYTSVGIVVVVVQLAVPYGVRCTGAGVGIRRAAAQGTSQGGFTMILGKYPSLQVGSEERKDIGVSAPF